MSNLLTVFFAFIGSVAYSASTAMGALVNVVNAINAVIMVICVVMNLPAVQEKIKNYFGRLDFTDTVQVNAASLCAPAVVSLFRCSCVAAPISSRVCAGHHRQRDGHCRCVGPDEGVQAPHLAPVLGRCDALAQARGHNDGAGGDTHARAPAAHGE